MARLRCPKCSTIVEAQAGVRPVCPGCGFGSRPAPAAVPAPAPVPEPPAEAPAPLAAPPSPPPPARPLPRRGWVLPVLWTMAVVYLLLESALLSMLSEPSEWEIGGAPPSGALLAGLAIADLALRIAIGVLVARDLKALGADRLRLAQVPATALERTSPGAWGALAGVFTLLILITLSLWRRRIARLARQAEAAPRFADRAQLKAASKAPGVFPEGEFKAMRRRGSTQTIVFLGLFVVLSVVSRI